MWVERKIEGDRIARMKLRCRRRGRPTSCCARAAKHAGRGSRIGLWTGFTFVGYFTPIRELGAEALHARASARGNGSGCCSTASRPTATPASCASRSASTCARMRASRARCSTSDTLIISYDAAARRAARLAAARGADAQAAQGLGDCIDCSAVRAGLPDRHRHPQGPAVRVHRLRRLHRRLRRRDGQDELPARPDPLRHAERHGQRLEPRRSSGAACCGRGCWSTARSCC